MRRMKLDFCLINIATTILFSQGPVLRPRVLCLLSKQGYSISPGRNALSSIKEYRKGLGRVNSLRKYCGLRRRYIPHLLCFQFPACSTSSRETSRENTLSYLKPYRLILHTVLMPTYEECLFKPDNISFRNKPHPRLRLNYFVPRVDR